MTAIKYSKLEDRFLITYLENGSGENLKISFSGVKDGDFYLGKESFKVENGIARINTGKLADGSYTPILRTEEKSYICDKLKVLAGILTPDVNAESRIYYLAGKIISAEERLRVLDKRISELSDSVYGKSIL